MAKTQKELDDDVRYRNRFRDGPNDPPPKKMRRKGQSSAEWWRDALGFGNKKGEGALAKRRKKSVDSQVKRAGG